MYLFGLLGVALYLLLLSACLFVLLVRCLVGLLFGLLGLFCAFLKVKLPFSFALSWVCVAHLIFPVSFTFAGLLL